MPVSHHNSIKDKKGKFVKLTNKQLLKNSHPKLLNEWDYQKNKIFLFKVFHTNQSNQFIGNAKKIILGLQVLITEL